MTLKLLLYVFSLVALVRQEQTCDAIVIHNATKVLEICIEDWFPQDIEFNESCVAEGCPHLKNMSFCPSDMDVNALRNITQTISDCITGPICGIVIDPKPLNYLMASLDQLLPGFKVKGIVTFPTGGGYLSNISNIQLDIMSNQSQHLPLEMTILIPNIRIHGHCEMEFLLESGFGPELTARFPKLFYEHDIRFVAIVLINNTGPNLDMKFVNPIINVSPQLCGIDLPPGFPNFQTLLNASLQMVDENSIMASAISRFLGKLSRSAIQVTSRNCKSFNVTI